MYVIRNGETDVVSYLNGLGIGSRMVTKPMDWTTALSHCIHFREKEEAEATIQFIEDVLDWELAEQLEVEYIR